MYLSKFENRFFQITQCSFPNVFDQIAKIDQFAKIGKCICPNWKLYLSKLESVFVQIGKCICPNWKKYLSKLTNIFVILIETIIVLPVEEADPQGTQTICTLQGRAGQGRAHKPSQSALL